MELTSSIATRVQVCVFFFLEGGIAKKTHTRPDRHEERHGDHHAVCARDECHGWHTQGAGKSLTMAFYAGRLLLHPA